MNTNIEKEYKLLVNEDQFYQLLAYYPTVEFRKQINTYYDTEENQIQSMKGAMRIREIDHSFLFTLKIRKDDDLFEYECPVECNDIQVFYSDEVKALLDQFSIYGPFKKTTTLTTNRGMYVTDYAELCFDESFYNDTKDYEIEYEYKKDHDGLSQFQSILQKISLTYEKNCASKIKRAMDSLK